MTTSTWLIILLVLTTGLAVLFFLNYHYYRSLVKHRGSLRPWPIQSWSLDKVDPIFHTNEFGPTLDGEVQFIGRGSLNVPGGTSDAEAWVLAALAKKAKTIFEFGTCTGKTSYLMAINSPPDARVFTLTLPPDQVNSYSREAGDSPSATKYALSESAFTRFLYTGTPAEGKITQLYCDSKHFDEAPYAGKMDLIFVDGSHAHSYVVSDSKKAFRMVRPGGLILWHDYRGPSINKDVYRVLNKISEEKNLVHIEGTSFIAYRSKP